MLKMTPHPGHVRCRWAPGNSIFSYSADALHSAEYRDDQLILEPIGMRDAELPTAIVIPAMATNPVNG